MKFDFDNVEKPIFLQLAEQVEDGILTGAFPEESAVPSITEFSVQYRINPATANRGINLLVDEGIVYKRRGIGMFVSAGAKEKVRQKRKQLFVERYITPLLFEAEALGISADEIKSLIDGCKK